MKQFYYFADKGRLRFADSKVAVFGVLGAQFPDWTEEEESGGDL